MRKICKPRTQEQIWSQPFCWSVSCCIFTAYQLMNPAQTTSRSSFSDSSSEDCLQSSKYVQCSCRPSTEGITGTSCEWLWPWLQYYIISNMIISYIFIYHHTYVVYCMQMYAIGSLIIWVSQLQANTVDASRVLPPPLPQLSLLTITNAILCVSWSCFPVTQISTNRLSHAHFMEDDAPYKSIQHIIPLPRHLVRLRWFMVLLTHIANGSEAATSSQSRRCGPPSGLPFLNPGSTLAEKHGDLHVERPHLHKFQTAWVIPMTRVGLMLGCLR